MPSSTAEELNGQMPQDYLKAMGWLQRQIIERHEGKRIKENSYREELALLYEKLLFDKGLPRYECGCSAPLIRYPVRVSDKNCCLEEAKRQRVEIGDWFDHPLHPAQSNLEGLNWNDAYCPNALEAARTVVNLPVYSRISFKTARKIVDFIEPYAVR